MANDNKTPAIRFKGFTDTWEQRKLSDTLNFLSNNTLSRAELSEDTGTYKNVHYGDVLVKFGEYIDAQSTDLPYIADDEKAKKFESSKLQDGDIIIADTAEDEAVGKCVEIGNIGDLSIVSGLHTIPCRSKVKFAPAYLGFYLNSSSYHDQLIPLMQGIKVTSISKSAISDTLISAPTDLSEQGKIGQFFSQLDTLITLHQRKYDKLIQFKAAMLQKMFPQNGADKPEIRFKGFTDAWEQRKLEEVITVGNGMDYKHLSEGDIPVYGTGGYMLSVDKALSYDKDAIGIGRKGTIDKPYVLKAPFWTVDTLFYCIPKEDYSLDFVYCIFQNVNWKEKDESTGVPSLSKVNINSTDVKVPTLAEQEKIGAYFAQLDNLITLHQRKCDKYKSIKAGLIRKLFP